MIDETSGIIGLPIGQQYREMAARYEANTTTWQTLIQNYKERAARDDARIEELIQRANHWHDTADMLKRQRDNAEEERDLWKVRAVQAVQEHYALRVERDGLRKCCAFFRSVIISGEPWSDQCQELYDAALAVQPTTGETK